MNIFKQIPVAALRHQTYHLPEDVLLSFRPGELIPAYIREVTYGDIFSINPTSLVRFAPLATPAMAKYNVNFYWFYCKFDLLFKDWYEFETKGRLGTSTVQLPLISSSDLFDELADVGKTDLLNEGSLADYMQLPVRCGNDSNGDYVTQGVSAEHTAPKSRPINMMPFRMYQRIYNTYFRDLNLSAELDVPDGYVNEGKLVEMLTLRRQAWSKDYFTSALPFAQRGEAVTIPLASDVNVYLDTESTKKGRFVNSSGHTPSTMPSFLLNGSTIKEAVDPFVEVPEDVVEGDEWPLNPSPSAKDMVYDPNGSLKAATKGATAVDIEALREAFALQRYLENNAVGGSRNFDNILARFGVRIPDYRLQVPQYLGGHFSPVTISDVFSSVGTADQPLATMAGRAVSMNTGNGFKNQFFYERGYLMCLVSVTPKAMYMQGLPKFYQKDDIFQFWQPEFENLGEQEILNSELFFDPSDSTTTPAGTFGYTPRYADYKSSYDHVHGDFRHSLDNWHVARVFDSEPALNTEFITCNPTDRVFADTDDTDDKIYMQIHFDVRAKRPMKYFSKH